MFAGELTAGTVVQVLKDYVPEPFVADESQLMKGASLSSCHGFLR